MTQRFTARIVSIMVTLLLCGCVYHIDIQQGNILSEKQMNAIHTGMTEQQVVKQLGAPLLTSMFQDNELYYVYTMRYGHHKMHTKRFIIYFRNGRVVSVEKTTNAQAPLPLPK